MPSLKSFTAAKFCRQTFLLIQRAVALRWRIPGYHSWPVWVPRHTTRTIQLDYQHFCNTPWSNKRNSIIVCLLTQNRKCCLITVPSKITLQGFLPKARDVAKAIANKPQSTPFYCCCTDLIWHFNSGFGEFIKEAHLFQTFTSNSSATLSCHIHDILYCSKHGRDCI